AARLDGGRLQGQRAGADGSIAADSQGAAAEQSGARIGVVAGDDEGSRAFLPQSACAADAAREGDVGETVGIRGQEDAAVVDGAAKLKGCRGGGDEGLPDSR